MFNANPDRAIDFVENSNFSNVVIYQSDRFADNLANSSGSTNLDTSIYSDEDAIELWGLYRQRMSNEAQMNRNCDIYYDLYKELK